METVESKVEGKKLKIDHVIDPIQLFFNREIDSSEDIAMSRKPMRAP